MTVRPITTPAALDRAHLELNAAVNRLSELPACRLSFEFTEDVPPGRALELVDRCNACPVLAECRVLAALLPARDLAHTVTAGVRYDGNGQRVDLAPVRKKVQRDKRLIEAAELEQAA